MKQYILLFFLLVCFRTFGQIVNITVVEPRPKPDTLCPGMDLQLKVSVLDTGVVDTVPYSYQWKKSGNILVNETSELLSRSEIATIDSGVYQCIATKNDTSYFSNEISIRIYQPLVIDTLYRFDNLHCPVCEHDVSFVCIVSGGNPDYIYNWGQGSTIYPVDNNVFVGLYCPGEAFLIVKDNNMSHCISRKYTVEALKLPPVKFIKDPKDTVYLTNPTLTVSFPDTTRQHLTYWSWTFVNDTASTNTDSTVIEMANPATHDYTATGTFPIKLFFTDVNGCDSTVMDSILVKQIDLKIPTVITPGGSAGLNDFFFLYDGNNKNDKLNLQEVYLSSRLVIFDRWGRKVYDRDNYANGTWDGDNLSGGVYYVIFKGHGKYEDDTVKGSLTIIR